MHRIRFTQSELDLILKMIATVNMVRRPVDRHLDRNSVFIHSPLPACVRTIGLPKKGAVQQGWYNLGPIPGNLHPDTFAVCRLPPACMVAQSKTDATVEIRHDRKH